MQFILDIHCHTIASGHALNTLEENLTCAKEIGLMLTGTSEHGPNMPGSCPLSHFLDIAKLPDFLNGMHWLKGAEANIINTSGKLDMPDDILAKLDFCIASVHSSIFYPGDKGANTEAIIGTMENPYVDIIGHLGDANVPINPHPIVIAAKKTGTLIEINNKSLIPGNRRYDGGNTIRKILALCKAHGTPVIAGSDAHIAKDVGQLEQARSFIIDSGIDESLVINTNLLRFKEVLKGKRRYGK